MTANLVNCVMRWISAIRLWFTLVGREVEPKSCGIPDPYRAKGRIGPITAWQALRGVRQK